MSNYYLEYIEADNGDLVDINYWHRHCASPELKALGDHPCPEWPDYTVVCAGCAETIHWADVDALKFDGSGELFGKGEIVCRAHLAFANDYRTEHWTPTDTGADACLICAEDRQLVRAERSMK